MYKVFLEIGFEAEMSTKEDPELLEIAEEECNENPATRATGIVELRKIIFERKECFPYRTDDEFLLRFLRAKKFVVPRAYKLLTRYCNFKEEYKYLYEEVDLWGLAKLKNAFECSMNDRPDVGRILILRFGMWDPCEFPVKDLLCASAAIIEMALRQPKIQVIGSTVIVDLEGTTLRHITAMTPSVVYITICLMGLAMPARRRALHVINYSWWLNSVFSVFRRFISQKVWDTINFHGSDLKSLHGCIDLECLPPRLGGTCKGFVGFQEWVNKVKKYTTEQFNKDMKLLGYVIKE